MKKTIDNIRYWTLLLFVILITVYSHPSIMDLTEVEDEVTQGSVLSPYILLVFNFLFLLCLRTKPFLQNSFFSASLKMFLFMGLSYLLTLAFFNTGVMASDIRSIFISVSAVLIGWQIELDSKRQYVLLVTYSGMALYVGLMQVIVNIGGFEILDEYVTDNKNALGAMLAGASYIFLFLGIMRGKHVKWENVVFLCLFVLTLFTLLTIRARSATLAATAMLIFMFFKRVSKKYMLISVSVTVFVVLFLFFLQFYFFPNLIDYIVSSFYQHHENDLTTGRTIRNIAALHFLSDHLWLGNLNVGAALAQIHNYALEKLYKYGLIFSLPILVVYVYIFIKAWRNSVRSDSYNMYNIGYYILLIPYIISLAEPTFPFGPGTACAFNFILFGMSIRQTDLIREKFIQNKIISFIK